jgi:hypothetical protein
VRRESRGGERERDAADMQAAPGGQLAVGEGALAHWVRRLQPANSGPSLGVRGSRCQVGPTWDLN